MSAERARFTGIPERIAGLGAMAMNLSWRSSRYAVRVFRRLDPVLWHRTGHNPVRLLQEIEPERLSRAASDPEFLELYDRARESLPAAEPAESSWFQQSHPAAREATVAYFCAEFGLHASVPIYSGGLGVLAGDHCKASSDLGVPLLGVGLLYRRGYFDQRVRLDGWQEDSDADWDLEATPLVRLTGDDGSPVLATLSLGDRELRLGAWRLAVGGVPVYLLDTDLEANAPEDRDLAGRLYAGGSDHRIRQEWLLGAGGVRVLRALGISPSVWHANEGHASFMLVERLRERVESGAALEEAQEAVRRSSAFTTHTPVPAGHDVFSREQVEEVVGRARRELGVSAEDFMELGRAPGVHGSGFHMTALAIRLSDHVNGVSRKHGQVTRELWSGLWPDRPEEETPVGHVTNGVHLPTWMASPVLELLDRELGPGWREETGRPEIRERILDLDEAALWNVHRRLKRSLLEFIRERARHRWRDRWRDGGHLTGAGVLLNEDVLTVGFARRFAEYKRAHLLFRDGERLLRLLTDPRRPVQVIFAGKAHPADDRGKEVLQGVHRAARDPSFEGRIAFLEDYDMHVAHRLVEGSDLWLNLPRVPKEACGTSGMKAALNGVPQLGTDDGWWSEGFTGKNGWRLPEAGSGTDVDARDADHLYRVLEEEVVPAYYDRDERGVPTRWTRTMRHALAEAAARFTAGRMVREYAERYYLPAAGEPATVAAAEDAARERG